MHVYMYMCVTDDDGTRIRMCEGRTCMYSCDKSTDDKEFWQRNTKTAEREYSPDERECLHYHHPFVTV